MLDYPGVRASAAISVAAPATAPASDPAASPSSSTSTRRVRIQAATPEWSKSTSDPAPTTKLRGAYPKSDGEVLDAVIRKEARRPSMEAYVRRGSEWRWLNTVSFWLASSFAMGSTLFIVGAAISMAAPLLHELGIYGTSWKRRVLVDYVYAIGACYFEIGAYLGYFEVINVGKGDDLRETGRRYFAGPEVGMSATGYWAALSYFVGATSFGLACFVGLYDPNASHAVVIWLEWLPQVRLPRPSVRDFHDLP